jgi:hypothetical protein
MDFYQNELKVQIPKFWLDRSTEYFTTLMPLEITKFIMNIIFWKTNWDFGADARGIAEISNLSLGIEPQRRKSLKKSIYQASMLFCAIKTLGWTVSLLEFSVVPVQLWWSNWFLVGVRPKNIYYDGIS